MSASWSSRAMRTIWSRSSVGSRAIGHLCQAYKREAALDEVNACGKSDENEETNRRWLAGHGRSSALRATR